MPKTKPPPPPPRTGPPKPPKGPPTAPAATVTINRASAAKRQPPRVVIHAVEGWGKTTVGAYAPEPIFLLAETGLLTLQQAGRVPDCDIIQLQDWQHTLAAIEAAGADHQTIVLDALSGIEQLCHQHVCNRDFHGDWGERGFLSFHKGYQLAVEDWLGMLAKLDATGCNVLLLAHSKIKTFANPLGSDYDRWIVDVHDKTWAATARWADAVLFGHFETVVRDGKAVGGQTRLLQCQPADAWVAKSRYGMPEEIEIPDAPEQSHATIWQYIEEQ